MLAGVGVVAQREEDPQRAREPIDLMIEPARRAGADAGAPALLTSAGHVAVPTGRWSYGNAPGMVVEAIGVRAATTVAARVGVLQQTLVGEACARIAAGEIDAALVVGDEAGHRLKRAQATGHAPSERASRGEPDRVLAPTGELRHPVELRAGLRMPIGIYAMIDSAFASARGCTVEDRLGEIAAMYSRFSEIAARNPHAWRRAAIEPDALRGPSERNPMLAFPYTRLVSTYWSVDQAAALLLCSAEKATAAGVPRERWLFPLVSTESNHMLPAVARRHLGACPGARFAGRAALEHAGLSVAEVDLIDLYCPFPIAGRLFAAELGLSPGRDLTVTGGMSFAGGPYNNYGYQATARVAELLRAGRGRTALVSNVSGVLTKQAFCVWSTVPGPQPFAWLDVTGAVERETAAKSVTADFAGDGVVAGCTVVHEPGRRPRGVAILDVEGDRRTVATTEEPALVAAIETSDYVGSRVRVHDGVFGRAGGAGPDG